MSEENKSGLVKIRMFFKTLFGFNSKRRKIKPSNVNPSSFLKGQIYRMSPGAHTTKPYYVMIKEVSTTYIITGIPGKHFMRINYPSYEWFYHTARMTYIGHGKDYEHYIYNQTLE